MENSYSNELLWTKDPEVLWRNYKSIFPNETMTEEESINAVTRLLIIGSILVYFNSGNANSVKLAVIGLVGIYLIDSNKEGFSSFALPESKLSKEHCVKPTVDNPFMNPNITTYDDPEVGAACEGEEFSDEADRLFNESLYRDVTDVYNRANGQLLFNTVPDTNIPNDREAFSDWLFGDMPSCKDNPYACNPHEDLRVTREYL